MDINELIYMREKQMMEYGFSMYTTYLFKKYWNEFSNYIKSKSKNSIYTEEKYLDFIKEKYDPNINKRKYNEVLISNFILNDFENYIYKIKNNNKNILVPENFKEIFNSYIYECISNYNSDSTIKSKKRNCIELLNLFIEFKLNKISDIDKNFVNKIINHYLDMSNKSNNWIKTRFWVLRDFLNYLYNMNIIYEDLKILVPKIKKITHKKLPKVFDTNEIDLFLKEAQNGNKRNYAIFLFAIRYGLRISDIKNLKFENIDWKNNIINYTQQKTKETNELPLTNEIGESLIDYINNERPKCESKYIFITLKPPYTKISNNYNLYDVVNKIIFNSKIKDKQKRGIHCFRHSLATNLLKTKTSLDIITPILGHVSKNTTTQYINLNNKSLSNLSLEDIYE